MILAGSGDLGSVTKIVIFVLIWLVSLYVDYRKKQKARQAEAPPSELVAESTRIRLLTARFPARIQAWRRTESWTRGLGVLTELVRPRVDQLGADADVAALAGAEGAVVALAERRKALEGLLARMDSLALGADEQIGLYVVAAFEDLKAEVQEVAGQVPLPPDDEGVPGQALLLNWAAYFLGDRLLAALDPAMAERVLAGLVARGADRAERFPLPPAGIRATALGVALGRGAGPPPATLSSVMPGGNILTLDGRRFTAAALGMAQALSRSRFVSLGQRRLEDLAGIVIPRADLSTREAPESREDETDYDVLFEPTEVAPAAWGERQFPNRDDEPARRETRPVETVVEGAPDWLDIRAIGRTKAPGASRAPARRRLRAAVLLSESLRL